MVECMIVRGCAWFYSLSHWHPACRNSKAPAYPKLLLPWQVTLDAAYTDIQYLNIWATWVSSSTIGNNGGFSDNLAVWLSSGAGAVYNAGGASYKCVDRLALIYGIAGNVWCDGYSGFSARYVTVVRNVANSRVSLQELRVWRGGEPPMCQHAAGSHPASSDDAQSQLAL